jgi:hypothetical protein
MSVTVTITDRDLAEDLELLVDERIRFIEQHIHLNRGPLTKTLNRLKAFHFKVQHMACGRAAPEWIEDGGIVNKKDD